MKSRNIIASFFIALMLVLTLPTQSFAGYPPTKQPLTHQQWYWAMYLINPFIAYTMSMYEMYLYNYWRMIEEQTFEDETPDGIPKITLP